MGAVFVLMQHQLIRGIIHPLQAPVHFGRDGVVILRTIAALSPDDKMRRASEMVLSEAYYQKKDKIRENMKSSLSDIELLTKTRERATVCLPFPSARVFRTVQTPQSPPSCSIRRIKRCTSPKEKAKRDVRSTQQK